MTFVLVAIAAGLILSSVAFHTEASAASIDVPMVWKYAPTVEGGTIQLLEPLCAGTNDHEALLIDSHGFFIDSGCYRYEEPSQVVNWIHNGVRMYQSDRFTQTQ
jgi:hypothetical protein